MNEIKINDSVLQNAVKSGMDEFVNVFYNAILEHYGGQITESMMNNVNSDQMTLVVFRVLHDEVMDGGFVQLI